MQRLNEYAGGFTRQSYSVKAIPSLCCTGGRRGRVGTHAHEGEEAMGVEMEINVRHLLFPGPQLRLAGQTAQQLPWGAVVTGRRIAPERALRWVVWHLLLYVLSYCRTRRRISSSSSPGAHFPAF
jgi:hypothetical protein